MSIDVRQFHQVFFEESFEGLDAMESALLELGGGATDPELIHTIFRGAHSIKGGSGTFGFTDVARFTHVMETLLDQMRSGTREITRDAVDLLLEAVDALREMLTAVRDGVEHDAPRIAALSARFDALLGSAVSTGGPAPQAGSADAAVSGWRIRFRPAPHMLQTGNDPVRMFRELATLGELVARADVSAVPEFAELDPETCYLRWELELRGDASREQIAEVFEWVEDDCELDIRELNEGTDPVAAEAEVPARDTEGGGAVAVAVQDEAVANRRRGSVTDGSIRVSIDKIDALINMVGELVITQSMLGQMGVDLEDLSDVRLEKLRDGLAELERNTRELQESVMRIRMLPISFAFNRFPRLVHDLGGKLGKKIELRLSGEQTELDKTVMEKIGDPLVHLVRNALDHGIESPQERRECGKPETGVLQLNAYHQGGNIVIEVSDDGRGLNRDRILAKARERGLVGADETPSDERIYDLIFHPGFSTADVVSDVSGRGVGMDVVRRNIKEVGGSVEVQTRPGSGSRFVIRLPLTLAILDGQLVKVGGQIYIIPLVSIVESLQVRRERVNAVVGQLELYKLREDYIPIVRMHEVFETGSAEQPLEDSLLVVVEGDGLKAGLLVDDLLGQQQVVIKSLETNFQRIPGISGATILGDGTVALILDVGGLIQIGRGRPQSKRLADKSRAA